jgi:cytochrome d ubiquinol oxidase subunit II
MMLADVVLAIIWTGVTAYAIFGGADFGAGILDLFAGSATRGREMRSQLEHSIGPVWEANHVWLIFVLVYLWTAFPTAFVSIMTTLYIPVMLAGLGIVMRGSAFAFRKWAPTLSKERVMGAAFAASSFVTPFFLGAVAGGVASGRVPPGNAAGNPWSSWLNPTSVLGGVLAIVACTYLAAVLVARDATRTGRAELASSFRQRALWAGFLSGAVALGGIFVLRIDAPTLYEGLTEPWGLAAIMLSAGAGVASLVAIARAHHHMSRVAAVVATSAIIWGWGIAQYPWLLPETLTVEQGAAGASVLISLIIAFVVAGLIAVPALVWLLSLMERGILGSDDVTTQSGSSDALIEELSSQQA